MKRVLKTGYVEQEDGMRLRYGTFNVPDVEPKRYIIFFNGRTEWVEKYLEFPDDLELSDDCGFLTWDHRGQGGSGGVKADSGGYDVFVKDAEFIIESVLGNKQPYTIISHSMGGLIAVHGMMYGKFNPQRAVLCSPLLGLPSKPLPHAIGRPMVEVMSFLGLGKVSPKVVEFNTIKFEDNKLTHNYDFYQHRIMTSPYMIPVPTIDWVMYSARAIDDVFNVDVVKNYKIPTLVIGGTHESVVDFKALSAWTKLVQSLTKADISFNAISGARHELLAEIPKYYDDALGQIKKFI